MLLAIDIGNTHTVLGLMEAGRCTRTERIGTDPNRTGFECWMLLRAFLGEERPDGAILCSVVPPVTVTLDRTLRERLGLEPLLVGAGVKTGLNIRIENPGEAGADLVAAAVGALRQYTPPMILIDLGTATTFTALDSKGGFVGGAIAPGVVTALESLTGKTSLLPSIRLEAPKNAIGANTVDCMRSGAVLGAAAMLDGLVDRMAEELGGEVTVVATGGLASTVVPHMRRNGVILNDNLLFDGLWAIFQRNSKMV